MLCLFCLSAFFFFFKQKTAYEMRISDWSSDVCSSDLLLHKRLSALDPEAGWLSEETADNRDRLDKARVWVVDPIDGTRDYVRGRAGWAISVALAEHGRPVIGVLNAPARGEHWEAVLGGGARRNGIALSVSAHSELAGARIPYHPL